MAPTSMGMPALLEPSDLTPDQNYCLEVAGFVVVPSVLSPAEVAELRGEVVSDDDP